MAMDFYGTKEDLGCCCRCDLDYRRGHSLLRLGLVSHMDRQSSNNKDKNKDGRDPMVHMYLGFPP